jgi:hypothetical protein
MEFFPSFLERYYQSRTISVADRGGERECYSCILPGKMLLSSSSLIAAARARPDKVFDARNAQETHFATARLIESDDMRGGAFGKIAARPPQRARTLNDASRMSHCCRAAKQHSGSISRRENDPATLSNTCAGEHIAAAFYQRRHSFPARRRSYTVRNT